MIHARKLVLVLLFGGLALSAAPSRADEDASGSATQLYDAANARARAGDVGHAVLDYERALLRAPRDADIAANLAATRARHGLNQPPTLPLALGSRTWSLVALAALWLACVTLALSWRMARRPLVVVAAAAGLVCSTACAALAWHASRDDIAVVLAAGPLGLSPFAGAAPISTLAAGEEVRLHEHHGLFVRATDGAGHAGWLLSSSVQLVTPRGG